MKAMNTPHLFTISTHCCHDACQGILHIYRVFVTLYPLATTMDISFDFMITKPYTNRLVTKKNQFHTWRKDNHLQT
jgi:ABC-type maltose transport system permease subunit